MDEPYLQARAEDIRELGTRILAHLTGEFAERAEYPTHTLLIGSRLSAFDLGRVPVAQLRGIISGEGSGLSHVAILARALGIPAVMGVGELPLERLDGESLILDGNSGQVYVRPDAALRRRYRKRIEAEQALAKELEGIRDLPTETPDGMPVSLYANAGLTADIPLGNMAGCAGIGLFRSELPFMRYERFPSEQEQFGIYRQVLAQMAPLPVNLRSLDAGGDKPLPYLPLQETNPALGWRGVRLTLDHPEIFLVQLRAALRADIGLGNLRLLLPMISGLDELEQARELLGRACRQLQEEGYAVTPPPLGVMIEVPAAVPQAGLLARQVDFVCVGSNDLIQYLLAADRNNPRVSQRLDPLHPAMMKAMRQILNAVHRAGRAVTVCGQMAADPACALVLLGMGFDGLSVNPNALPRLKWTVHSVSAECMRSLARQVMRCQQPGPARRLLDRTLLGAGLGRLRASVNDSSG
jgi:phosphotransferase system enzyme I (PtsP)